MSSAKKITIFPPTIGSIVPEITSTDQNGILHGITSRGLFLKTDNRRIIYLTPESFKGPLTINLEKNLTFPKNVSSGTPVYLKPGKILIPGAGLEVCIRDSAVWEASLPAAQILPVREQECRLKSLGEQITRINKKTGLSWLLPYFLETTGTSPPADPLKRRQLDAALNLRRSLRAVDTAALSSGLSEFMGSGPGLTPSGDDFVLGMILCLNRWKDASIQHSKLKNLNHEVVESAFRLTTTLSANLIQCAALGLADERLLRALDWIISDFLDSGHLADGLLEWGHSSGVDVFTGFAAMLS